MSTEINRICGLEDAAVVGSICQDDVYILWVKSESLRKPMTKLHPRGVSQFLECRQDGGAHVVAISHQHYPQG